MEKITAIILGIIQGLTEFLPISSSGHVEIIRVMIDSNSIENFFNKQLLFVLFSFSICSLLILLNINFYFKYASIIYIIMVLLLILLLFVGKEVNGAKSWFNFLGFSLQPSELMLSLIHI